MDYLILDKKELDLERRRMADKKKNIDAIERNLILTTKNINTASVGLRKVSVRFKDGVNSVGKKIDVSDNHYTKYFGSDDEYRIAKERASAIKIGGSAVAIASAFGTPLAAGLGALLKAGLDQAADGYLAEKYESINERKRNLSVLASTDVSGLSESAKKIFLDRNRTLLQDSKNYQKFLIDRMEKNSTVVEKPVRIVAGRQVTTVLNRRFNTFDEAQMASLKKALSLAKTDDPEDIKVAIDALNGLAMSIEHADIISANHIEKKLIPDLEKLYKVVADKMQFNKNIDYLTSEPADKKIDLALQFTQGELDPVWLQKELAEIIPDSLGIRIPWDIDFNFEPQIAELEKVNTGIESTRQKVRQTMSDTNTATSLITTGMQQFGDTSTAAYEASIFYAERLREELARIYATQCGTPPPFIPGSKPDSSTPSGTSEPKKKEPEAGQSILGAIGSSFQKYGEEAKDAGQIIETVFTGALTNVENQFIKFVQTGKFEFSSLVDSMLADLTRLIIQNAIMKPIAAGIGNFFSPQQSTNNPAVGGTILNTLVAGLLAGYGSAHRGGVAGIAMTGSTRVNPLVFAYANRYHSGGVAGLKRGEIPAILKHGESIFTPQQAATLAPLSLVERATQGISDGASSRVVNNISITPPAGYEAQRETSSNNQGGEDVKITFSRLAAAEASRFGSPLNRTLQTGGFKQQPVRRGG